MRRRSTGERSGFRLLVATDGSPSARAALMTACVFPWPRDSHARGVVALPPGWFNRPEYVRSAVAKSFERLAASARRQLRRRWPEAEVIFEHRQPVEGILGAAKRFSADVIVLGWRGHGVFRRLLMGSVSRRVVEGSPGSVLIVRRRAREIRRAVIGVDGSKNARRAVDFTARLDRDGLKQVTVVRVIEPMALQTAGLLPSSVRATLRHSVAVLNRNQLSGQSRGGAKFRARKRRRFSPRVLSVVRDTRRIKAYSLDRFAEIPLDYEECIEWQLLIESCLEKKTLTRPDPIAAATFKLYE